MKKTESPKTKVSFANLLTLSPQLNRNPHLTQHQVTQTKQVPPNLGQQQQQQTRKPPKKSKPPYIPSTAKFKTATRLPPVIHQLFINRVKVIQHIIQDKHER